MINTQAGPDKGLLDIIFGSKPEAAQAGTPESAAGAIEQVPAEFAQALAKAQDQKAAQQPGVQVQNPQHQQAQAQAQIGAQPKGETRQTAKTDGVKAEAAPKPAKSSKKEKAEAGASAAETSGVAAMVAASQSTRQAQAQPLASAKAAAKQQPRALVGASATGGVPAAGGKPGAQIDAQAVLAAARQAAETAKQAAHAASQAAKQATQAATGQAPAAQAAMVQPIVIQMPTPMPVVAAMPVDVLESHDDQAYDVSGTQPGGAPAFGGASTRQHVSSQDFLAQRGGLVKALGGNTLGVDRGDPRLRGGLNGEEAKQSDRLDLALPQLGLPGQQGRPVDPTLVHTNGQVQVTAPGTAAAGLSNTSALAMDVARLANRGGGSIRMRVMPEALGELTIHVEKTKGQQLNVRFEAATREARDAIANSLPELRQVLETSRHNVGSLEVRGEVDRANGLVQVSQPFSTIDTAAATSGSWQSGGQFQQGERGDQGGSAWGRYLDQQEARQQYQQNRQNNGGYRRYQEQLGA